MARLTSTAKKAVAKVALRRQGRVNGRRYHGRTRLHGGQDCGKCRVAKMRLRRRGDEVVPRLASTLDEAVEDSRPRRGRVKAVA